MSSLGDYPEGANVSYAPWNQKDEEYDTYEALYSCNASKVMNLQGDGDVKEDWAYSDECDLEYALIEAKKLARLILNYFKDETSVQPKTLKHTAMQVLNDCDNWNIEESFIEKY